MIDYPSFKRRQDPELSRLTWLWFMNRGFFVTPGREQEWNLTVAHDEQAVDRYVEAFAGLARQIAVSGRLSGSARA